MNDTTETERCILSELLVSECGCRIHAKAEAVPEFIISARFAARFNSRCNSCNGPIHEGDPMARTVDGYYICDRCAS